MKNTIKKISLSLLGSFGLFAAQAQLINNNAPLTIQSGLAVTATGDFTNNVNGSIANSGEIIVNGDWNNNASNGAFTALAGDVYLSGATLNIGGSDSTAFYNLWLTGSTEATVNTGAINSTGLVINNNFNLGAGSLLLNRRTLHLKNGNASALTTSTGYIFTDENDGNPNPNFSKIKWDIASNTGMYSIPLRTLAGQTIPLTYNVTTGGDTGGFVVFGQYVANYLNSPLPGDPVIANLDFNGINGELTSANRFWRIDASSYTTQPVADVTFSYNNNDLSNNLTGTTFIDETTMAAYHYDNTAGEWSDAYAIGTVDQLQNTYAITGVIESDSWWVLADRCSGFSVDAGADVVCGGTATTLSAIASGSIGTVSYNWSPVDSLSCNNCQTTTSTVNYTSTYTATATDNYGCIATDDVIVIVNAVQPSICMVTVDSTSTKNKIVWDKSLLPTLTLDSVFIYRKNIASTYDKVGAVHIDSLSQYIDSDIAANPNASQNSYKLSTLDSCGVESVLSDFHTTIFMNQWFAGPSVQVSWQHYVGFPTGYFYEVYRDTIMDGTHNNWHPINNGTNYQVASSVQSINDLSPPATGVLNSTTRYEIRIAIPGGNCDALKAVSYGSTRSNKQQIAGGTGQTPVPAFTSTTQTPNVGTFVDFMDVSSNNPTSRQWFFPGGSPASESIANPTVLYNAPGTYDVRLKPTNATGTGDSTFVGYIIVAGPDGIVGIAELNSVLIFPNPAEDHLFVSLDIKNNEEVQIELLNLEGKIIQTKKVKGAGSVSVSFEVLDLASGAYLLKFTTKSGTITKHVVKK